MSRPPPPWIRHVTTAVVVLVVAILAWWLVDTIGLGPDPDSDSYGHHVIARLLLVEPGNHGVHWVWLPLFHWLQVPLIKFGATMDTVRYLNVALWCGVPLLLFHYLRRPRQHAGDSTGNPSLVAALAALFAALCPIGMQMGSTAQPEPLFALLVLGFTATLESKRWWWAALCLSAAVMTRYEAWAVLGVTGLWLGVQVLRARGLKLRDGAYWPYLLLALPALSILAWAIVRVPFDGRLFGFIGDTRKFANEALGSKSAFQYGFVETLNSSIYYAGRVNWRVFGPAMVLGPLGTYRLYRRYPLLALSGGACLFMITLSWLMRSSLGLDRHFVSVIPLVATSMALGVEVLADGLAKLTGRPKAARLIGATILSVCALGIVGHRLDSWMGHWRGSTANGYQDRRAVAAYLQKVPEKQLIFCDEATVEVISKLPRLRFERRDLNRKDIRVQVDRVLEAQGEVYLATWASKLKHFKGRGEVVFRPEGASETTGLGVMRLKLPARAP